MCSEIYYYFSRCHFPTAVHAKSYDPPLYKLCGRGREVNGQQQLCTNKPTVEYRRLRQDCVECQPKIKPLINYADRTTRAVNKDYETTGNEQPTIPQEIVQDLPRPLSGYPNTGQQEQRRVREVPEAPSRPLSPFDSQPESESTQMTEVVYNQYGLPHPAHEKDTNPALAAWIQRRNQQQEYVENIPGYDPLGPNNRANAKKTWTGKWAFDVQKKPDDQ